MSIQRFNPRGLVRQRGAAALIVVLVLFFIVSLVAAYTSRSMIFEQRTSTNQFRSTQAIEVAEAGVEWAITKLNAGLINGTCATDAAGASTFRQRYLTFAASTGAINPVAGASATCVLQPGTGWNCSCPAAGASIPAVAGIGPFPAFRVYFEADRGVPRANLIRVSVSACTNVTPGCLSNPQVPEPGQGNASVSTSVGLKGAIDTIPAAALTIPAATIAAASLTLTGGTLVRAYNAQQVSGVAIQTGGTLVPEADVTVFGPPGTPADSAKVKADLSLSFEPRPGPGLPGGGLRKSGDVDVPDDATCASGHAHLGCPANRMFTGVFGAPRATYRAQPALVLWLGDIGALALRELARKNPRSVLWVTGDVALDDNLGSSGDPVVLIVEGSVDFSGATLVIGSIYSISGNWSVSGTPAVQGALVSETAATLAGGVGDTLEVRYDRVVLDKLRSEHGSFVRVPGGWRDWQP